MTNEKHAGEVISEAVGADPAPESASGLGKVGVGAWTAAWQLPYSRPTAALQLPYSCPTAALQLPYSWRVVAALSEQQLERHQQVSRAVLAAMDKTEPGCSPRRGHVLLSLSASRLEYVRRTATLPPAASTWVSGAEWSRVEPTLRSGLAVYV